MTGWGQTGPLSHAAGHDLNYIALSGALHAIGPAETPVVPLNLIGDFGGGGMYLAFGMVCAFLEATKSGQGQVVDAAITDGTAHLTSMIYAMAQAGHWSDNRADNILDGAAPFYGLYQCACGGFVAIGAIEPQFYALLLAALNLPADYAKSQHDRATWPARRAEFAALFAQKSREDWTKAMEGTDICFAPVLTLAEAFDHPHNQARDTFITDQGIRQPAPAPRLSRTPGQVQPASQTTPLNFETVLANWQDFADCVSPIKGARKHASKGLF